MSQPTNDVLVLATRRSPLARRQAEMVRDVLAAWPGAWWKKVELLELTTTGDKQKDWSLAQEGGKGLFTRELEEALLEGRAHLAVHSAKDLPTTLPDGLTLAGFLPRADARDVLIRREEIKIPRRIASGSPRRRAQALALFSAVEWSELRGNVETRLKKIAEGAADATFLAAAGLQRLGIEKFDGLVFEPVPIEKMVPAAGQGAIALESRVGDAAKFAPVFCATTFRAVTIERAGLAALGGGCQSASGVHCVGNAVHVFHEPKGRKVFAIEPGLSSEVIADVVASINDWIRKP